MDVKAVRGEAMWIDGTAPRQKRAWCVAAPAASFPAGMLMVSPLPFHGRWRQAESWSEAGLAYSHPIHTLAWSAPVHGPCQIPGDGTHCVLSVG